jgi:hypothetical protein
LVIPSFESFLETSFENDTFSFFFAGAGSEADDPADPAGAVMTISAPGTSASPRSAPRATFLNECVCVCARILRVHQFQIAEIKKEHRSVDRGKIKC